MNTGWMIRVAPGEPLEALVRKAAQVVPSARQLAWQRQELIAFIHFGINTFTDREWGTGLEDSALFCPSDLDVQQWARALRDAGFTQVILTAKHHDGFCLWPSRYTDFSVKNIPWRNGQGDVLRDLAQAARAEGLRLGVYLSPADLHELEAPGGRYGNGSAPRESLIPTLLPGDTRTPPQSFTFEVNDYNRYYLNQLYELLTEYGPVDEVWFDGANPKPDHPERYSYAAWFALVRALMPDAVMLNGPDLRWVGNEDGYAREAEWSVLPWRGEPEADFRAYDPLAVDLGSRERLSDSADYLVWQPAEVDVSIRPGWFYHAHEDAQVKSLEQLLDIYLLSVGRNAVLLLNIPPDPRGKFADADLRALQAFGDAIRQSFAHDLLRGAPASGPHDPAGPPAHAVDGDPTTCWLLPDGATSGDLLLELDQPARGNLIVLQEQLTYGQRVEAFAVEAWLDGAWQPIAAGQTIGCKRILRIAPIEAQRLRLRISAARLRPAIATFALFNAEAFY